MVLEWADAIVFSAPTRYRGLPSQARQFIDSTGGLRSFGNLPNKVVSGMTSANNPHGGPESTLLSLYTSMHHWGAIIAAPAIPTKLSLPRAETPTALASPQEKKI